MIAQVDRFGKPAAALPHPDPLPEGEGEVLPPLPLGEGERG